MKVAIVHDAVADADAADAKDVIAQADAVEEAMAVLGHEVRRFFCTLDLSTLQRDLVGWGADLAFNLVESIGGKGRLIHLAPACLDAMGMAYTGARTEAMMLTSNKALAKQWMTAAGIATPAWIGPWPGNGETAPGNGDLKRSWIVKSVWEHASIGLDEQSIITGAGADVLAILPQRATRLGGACFAEHFIDGREFNLSILAGRKEPEVLPPAEILFEGYEDDRPRIVDYRAKWDETAWAYHHTPRSFDFDDSDRVLLAALKETALGCWRHFDLSGYARVDFRVDRAGRPWVLEVNANPCLSADAGFAAALNRGGIDYSQAIGRILADAFVVNLDDSRIHRL
ncbi:MAG: D-alanine--D-alanine ligase [Desulfobacterales bacterium]|nr:D-alanine--D-alanine ligase [Desulfobacterales bacterium]